MRPFFLALSGCFWKNATGLGIGAVKYTAGVVFITGSCVEFFRSSVVLRAARRFWKELILLQNQYKIGGLKKCSFAKKN